MHTAENRLINSNNLAADTASSVNFSSYYDQLAGAKISHVDNRHRSFPSNKKVECIGGSREKP